MLEGWRLPAPCGQLDFLLHNSFPHFTDVCKKRLPCRSFVRGVHQAEPEPATKETTEDAGSMLGAPEVTIMNWKDLRSGRK
jgi:hypothetical protein